MGKRRALRFAALFRAKLTQCDAGGTAKQHSMDVDSTKAAATDGWDYGGGATLGGGDDMTDGAAGAGEGTAQHAAATALRVARSPAARAVAPPRTAPSVSLGGDGSAKMGLFGLVTGGCAPAAAALRVPR